VPEGGIDWFVRPLGDGQALEVRTWVDHGVGGGRTERKLRTARAMFLGGQRGPKP